MGRGQTGEGDAAAVPARRGSMFPFETMVHEHLRHNCYPPVVGLDTQAIEAIHAVEDDEPARLIDMPGGGVVPAAELVEGLHLHGLIGFGADDE